MDRGVARQLRHLLPGFAAHLRRDVAVAGRATGCEQHQRQAEVRHAHDGALVGEQRGFARHCRLLAAGSRDYADARLRAQGQFPRSPGRRMPDKPLLVNLLRPRLFARAALDERAPSFRPSHIRFRRRTRSFTPSPGSSRQRKTPWPRREGCIRRRAAGPAPADRTETRSSHRCSGGFL